MIDMRFEFSRGVEIKFVLMVFHIDYSFEIGNILQGRF